MSDDVQIRYAHAADSPEGHLVVEETSSMALAHWRFSNGDKVGLGLIPVERYRDPECGAAFCAMMRKQAARTLDARNERRRAAEHHVTFGEEREPA